MRDRQMRRPPEPRPFGRHRRALGREQLRLDARHQTCLADGNPPAVDARAGNQTVSKGAVEKHVPVAQRLRSAARTIFQDAASCLTRGQPERGRQVWGRPILPGRSKPHQADGRLAPQRDGASQHVLFTECGREKASLWLNGKEAGRQGCARVRAACGERGFPLPGFRDMVPPVGFQQDIFP